MGATTTATLKDALPVCSEVCWYYWRYSYAQSGIAAIFDLYFIQIMHGIQELGKEARRVLQGTTKAFADRDVKAARYIWEEDDVVDVRYHLVRHDLMAMMVGARAIPALQNDS